jgi:hypothetical protein
MIRHRLAQEADYYRLPAQSAPRIQPTGFVMQTVAVVPVCTLAQWAGVQSLYLHAFEQALAAATPSVTDRGLFGFWN